MASTDATAVQAFHPQPIKEPSPEYVEFLGVRQRILDVIRTDSPKKQKFIVDLADALLDYDKSLPSNLSSSLVTILSLGKRVHERTKRRALYMDVLRSLLEQIVPIRLSPTPTICSVHPFS